MEKETLKKYRSYKSHMTQFNIKSYKSYKSYMTYKTYTTYYTQPTCFSLSQSPDKLAVPPSPPAALPSHPGTAVPPCGSPTYAARHTLFRLSP